jgi:hypothetical protein
MMHSIRHLQLVLARLFDYLVSVKNDMVLDLLIEPKRNMPLQPTAGEPVALPKHAIGHRRG